MEKFTISHFVTDKIGKHKKYRNNIFFLSLLCKLSWIISKKILVKKKIGKYKKYRNNIF